MIKQLNPPLTLDNVEIMGFDDSIFHLHAIFHIYADEPMVGPNIQTNMVDSVRNALRYMETEGFLPAKKLWKINAAIMLHPSKNKT